MNSDEKDNRTHEEKIAGRNSHDWWGLHKDMNGYLKQPCPGGLFNKNKCKGCYDYGACSKENGDQDE